MLSKEAEVLGPGSWLCSRSVLVLIASVQLDAAATLIFRRHWWRLILARTNIAGDHVEVAPGYYLGGHRGVTHRKVFEAPRDRGEINHNLAVPDIAGLAAALFRAPCIFLEEVDSR